MTPLNVTLVSPTPVGERVETEIKQVSNEGNLKTSNPEDKKSTVDADAKKIDTAAFEVMQQNIEKINEIFPLTTTNLSFEFDKSGSESFIRVIDRDNQKVIREIPSEEFRKVAKALDEFADNFRSKGLIFDRTA